MNDDPTTGADAGGARHFHLPSWPWLLAIALGIVAAAWAASAIAHRVADIDLAAVDHPYLLVAAFVVFDAIVPIFPSESLLNAGSILATGDDSSITIWKLIVAGSAGAVVGDTILYWLARTVLRGVMAERLERARRDERVSEAFDVFQDEAAVLIVGGRFVPGIRFAVGASMGLSRHPYPSFLLWDAIGGVLWASFSCLSSALVATAIGGQPLVSLVASTVITTALLAFLVRRLKSSLAQRHEGAPSA